MSFPWYFGPPSNIHDWVSSWDGAPMGWDGLVGCEGSLQICQEWTWEKHIYIPSFLKNGIPGSPISKPSSNTPSKCPRGMMHDPWAGMVPKRPKCTRAASTSLQRCGHSWICPIQMFAQDCVNYDDFLIALRVFLLFPSPLWRSWDGTADHSILLHLSYPSYLLCSITRIALRQDLSAIKDTGKFY